MRKRKRQILRNGDMGKITVEKEEIGCLLGWNKEKGCYFVHTMVRGDYNEVYNVFSEKEHPEIFKTFVKTESAFPERFTLFLDDNKLSNSLILEENKKTEKTTTKSLYSIIRTFSREGNKVRYARDNILLGNRKIKVMPEN